MTDVRPLPYATAPGPRPTIASWLALAAACGTSAGVAWYVVADRPRWHQVFHDFRVELPTVTQWMLQVPDVAFAAAAVVAAGVAVAAQAVRRRRGGATAVHLLVTLAAVLVLLAYRETIFQAFSALVLAVRGPVGPKI